MLSILLLCFKLIYFGENTGSEMMTIDILPISITRNTISKVMHSQSIRNVKCIMCMSSDKWPSNDFHCHFLCTLLQWTRDKLLKRFTRVKEIKGTYLCLHIYCIWSVSCQNHSGFKSPYLLVHIFGNLF